MWGDYFKHVMSWYGHRNDPNVPFVIYGNLKTDPGREMRRIGQFIGGPCNEIVRDDRRLQWLIELTRFEEMGKANDGDDHVLLMRPGAKFYRKGQIGDYRQHMTDRQIELLMEKYDGYMKWTFLHDLWRKYLP